MSARIELTDDGTMDTVVRCRQCGAEGRYTYDPDCPVNTYTSEKETYEAFATWAINDFDADHDCSENDSESDEAAS